MEQVPPLNFSLVAFASIDDAKPRHDAAEPRETFRVSDSRKASLKQQDAAVSFLLCTNSVVVLPRFLSLPPFPFPTVTTTFLYHTLVV